MGASQACCYRREEEPLQPRAERCESWHSLPDVDEHWHLFEDVDSEPSEDVGSGNKFRRRSSWTKLRGRPLQLVPEEAVVDHTHGQSPPRKATVREEDLRNADLVPRVAERVIHTWTERRAHPEQLCAAVRKRLEDGFQELEEWTSRDHCLRMLRALGGDEDAAVKQLTKAIECRVRDRELYATLACEVKCDVRVIGRDVDHRPTVYICARSQKCPLREIAPQVQLAFEAGVMLSEYEGAGQIVLVADMHGFSPSLYMDMSAIQELSETLGSVFADRFASILMVDFSIVAQGIWSLAKPLLSEKTQNKINFVSVRKAREIITERFAESTRARITSSFDINRERSIGDDERIAHAFHTSICDVPLGHVRPADIAG